MSSNKYAEEELRTLVSFINKIKDIRNYIAYHQEKEFFFQGEPHKRLADFHQLRENFELCELHKSNDGFGHDCHKCILGNLPISPLFKGWGGVGTCYKYAPDPAQPRVTLYTLGNIQDPRELLYIEEAIQWLDKFIRSIEIIAVSSTISSN